MPDGEQTQSADGAGSTDEPSDVPVFSAYGVASAVLGVLSVAAIVLTGMIWTTHRSDVNDRRYLGRVMQTAAEWTGVLINMNTDNIDESLQRLHDGTVGDLNADFDSAIQPYRQVVQRLKSRSTGQVEAVAIEAVHHELDAPPGGRPPAEPLPAEMAKRTDNVMVVATSVNENTGGKPQIVHWHLRLAVSDVDGRLLISRLESIR
ncbi:hypothetical protein [Mycobacterium shimoidei]|uniref:hypothetical protein n=1 Tax=Mycobacterium shimoidei TaxID=29313 RepID=UPI000848DD41|nr:hypothetical protein [Mycobacterium shimoidei]MCV7258585.1 hypothetical protein [Mycobacterium shimoidei]ODR15474.1 hypothetical protein BHQ16_01750 [Mycobacterium shimoidei]ORW83692.1 hypothetical protein AWC26_01215 [Mycobacterium shimoidei]